MFFECTILNLATYRQFTSAAWDWIIIKKKNKTTKKQNKTNNNNNNNNKKKIRIALSLGYPSSYFYNKRCNMLLWWLYLSFSWLHKVAAFCQCQCHSSCLRTWSIHNNDNNNNNNNNNFCAYFELVN